MPFPGNGDIGDISTDLSVIYIHVPLPWESPHMKLKAYSFQELLSFLHVPSLILYTPFYSFLYPDVLPFLSLSTGRCY